MVSFHINLIMLLLFSWVIAFLFRHDGKRFTNALILFYVLIAVRVSFLIIWTWLHSHPFDWNYLQFPDENQYAINFQIGDPRGNYYCVLTYYLKKMGFSIINLKMINIFIGSFAVIRLYSIVEYVTEKNRYMILLGTLGGIFYLHTIYYSIFVLKESVFFYLSVEFLVQLIKRRQTNNLLAIFSVYVLLIAIRKQMLMAGCVFLFDRNWRFKKRTAVLGILFLFIIFEKYGHKLNHYIVHGLHYSLKLEGTKTELREFVRMGVFNSYSTYLGLVMVNIKRALSIAYQNDMTNKIILVLEWGTILWLMLSKNIFKMLISFWPILLVAVLYFFSGVITMYNIRYNIFPVTFFLYVLILINCGVKKEQIVSS